MLIIVFSAVCYKNDIHIIIDLAIIAGDPPAFVSTDNPMDQFVFEVDDAGNPVSLVFTCPVTGSGPPEITW